MKPLVVVPTYCEAENVEELLRRIRATVPAAHVLVVDDGSPDGTADLVESIGAALGQIDVLRRSKKAGLGAAYRAGFAVGLERGFDVLIEMDADLSHDPAALPALLAAIDAGADLAIGSRYGDGGGVEHWPWHRRALSRWGNRYAAFALALPVTDATAGFRAYRRTALERSQFDATGANGYAFQIEMAYRVHRSGGVIAEVPIVFRDRTRGSSKMSPKIAIEAMAIVTRWAVRDRILRRDRTERSLSVG